MSIFVSISGRDSLTPMRLCLNYFFAFVLLSASHASNATPGDLDTSFGNNGSVITEVAGFDNSFFSLAIQPDDKIVVAGRARDYYPECRYRPYCFRFLVARYTYDGILDSSFGDDGIVTSSVTEDSDGRAVAVLPNGKILVAGYSSLPSRYGPAMVRYNQDGSLDTTFGNNGKVSTFISQSGATANSMAIQSDGKILLGGNTGKSNGLNYFLLIRYHEDGTLDTSFGGNGFVTTDLGVAGAYSHALALQDDGKILLAGRAYPNESDTYEAGYGLVRYESSGDLDLSFGDGGRVVTAVSYYGGNFGGAQAIAIQPDGKILLSGNKLVRLETSGQLDTSFGEAGVSDVTDGWGVADPRVYVQESGQIVQVADGISRFHSNGVLSDFAPISSALDSLGSVYTSATQGEEKIVLAHSHGTALSRVHYPLLAPPSPPAIDLGDVSATTAEINISPSEQGSDPITSYTASCEIPDRARVSNTATSVTSTDALILGTPSTSRRSALRGVEPFGSADRSAGLVYTPNPKLRTVKTSDLITFLAPDGQEYTVPVEFAQTTPRGNLEIRGSDGELSIHAVISDSGNFFGSIETGAETYQAIIASDQTLVYSSADGGISQNPFLHDMDLERLALEQVATSRDLPASAVSSSPTTITVGVLYDNAIRDNVDYSAMIDFYIGVANQSYQNSGVDIQFEVVATKNYEPYISYTDMYTTLSWITCNSTDCSPLSGVNPTIDAWRNTHRADMVAQFVFWGTTGGTCGIAQLPWDANNITTRNNLKQYTYSVNALYLPLPDDGNPACKETVLAHEMGHNFGLWHDRATLVEQGWTGVPAPVFPYAHGYKVDGVFGTVMSYTSQPIRNLSTPNLTYNGYPIGIPINQANEAFSAQAVANVMGYHAAIYDNTPTVYHTVTASAGAGGSISPSSISVEEGSSTSFTVSPTTNYTISSVTGCGGTMNGNTYTTGPITGACNVVASFSSTPPPTYFTVSTSAGTGGSVSPSSRSVEEGLTTTFSIIPDENYSIESVTGCDGLLSGNVYTTSPVRESCNVNATFHRYRWSKTQNSTSVLFTNLPTGFDFVCSAIATSNAGNSQKSNVVSFRTIAPTAPSRPVITRYDYGDGEIYLYVTADDGGESITGYNATCTDGTNTFTGTSTSSPITVSGLTNDVAYTCTVTATNSVGTGSVSAATAPITPEETATGLPIWLLYQATQSN